jgi:hypothetical protein
VKLVSQKRVEQAETHSDKESTVSTQNGLKLSKFGSIRASGNRNDRSREAAVIA